ncbi:MAG: hypothetical protein ACOC6Q_03190 [Patescibacteria group bacterium]
MSTLAHIIFYIVLVVALGCAGVLLYTYRGLPGKQLPVVIGISIFYTVWGAVHHILEDEFDFEVLLDYLLISGLVIVLFLLSTQL